MSNQFSSLIRNPELVETPQSNTLRFSQAAWFEFVQKQTLLVAGRGGIGSWLSLMLARLNPAWLIIVDPDVVEPVNMAGQMFRDRDIGQYKVSAVMRTVGEYSQYHKVNSFSNRIEEDTEVPNIVFGGFDNMTARRVLYECWKRKVNNTADPSDCLLVDGRLSAEVVQVFCMTGADTYYMEKYEAEWLFADEEAENTVCSYKQTSYCANLIASLMTNLFVNWCTNKCNPLIERSLPFMTEYTAEQFYLKTEV